jgi:hypothetical protein
MKIKNWIACVQDRGKWKEIVEKAKTFNQEVQRLEEEEIDKLHIASGSALSPRQRKILGAHLRLTDLNVGHIC